MGENLDLIKNMVILTVAAPLAGAAMGTVGGIALLSSGVKGATQAAIGGGLLSHSIGMSKSLFKFK